MKVTRLETIHLAEHPNILWVQVYTDEGLVGLGETFGGAEAVSAYVHESVAPYLLGEDPLQIDRHAKALTGYLGFRSSGVETRGNSAVDIALWDLFGQAADQPIYQLLGGLSRDRIRVYNTCAGYSYVRQRLSRYRIANWELPRGGGEGPYEDLDAFLHRAGALAESLLDQGITGMKIWPLDPYAEASGGMYISGPDLTKALEPFRKIRSAVGDQMDVMVEMHSLWNLPAALRLARALEEFNPFWYEDPIKMDSLGSLAEFARGTRVPVCASETLGSRWAFRDLLELKAIGVVMLDLSWVGGLSEAKKIAGMAEAYHLPVAPHDCTGPVVLTASVHLSLNAVNALIQEFVRAFYYGWYRDLVTDLPQITSGYINPPSGPGLGTQLQPGVLNRADATVRRSDAR
jgi:L-alanine-DL-glutamate epimerase-like enolase superfamily enzyme